MKIICVIPAWNEIERRRNFALPRVIEEILPRLDSVVVIDDGSRDGTYEAVAALPVDVIRHPVNRGQGAALKTGTLHALAEGADMIVHFDADGQFRAEDIDRAVEPIREGRADIVFGSRFLDNTTRLPFFKKWVIMPAARVVNRLFFGIRVSDPQSGFRVLSRRAAETIDWQQDAYAHCSEILVAAHRSGLPMTEVPITVLYNEFGQNFSGGVAIIRDLFLRRLNH